MLPDHQASENEVCIGKLAFVTPIRVMVLSASSVMVVWHRRHYRSCHWRSGLKIRRPGRKPDVESVAIVTKVERKDDIRAATGEEAEDIRISVYSGATGERIVACSAKERVVTLIAQDLIVTVPP